MDSRTSSEADDADKACLLERGSRDGDELHQRRSGNSLRSRYVTLSAVLLLLCTTNLVTFYLGRHSGKLEGQPCESVAEPQKSTPMLRDLDLKTMHVRFDSTLFDQGSRYRGPPSAAIDAAWEYVGANCMRRPSPVV